MEELYIFTAEVLASKPLCGVCEITRTAPDDILETCIGHMYEIFALLDNPTEAGEPSHRVRKFFFFYLKGKKFYGRKEEFKWFTTAKMILNGDIYFQRSSEERMQRSIQRAAKRGHIYTSPVDHISVEKQITALMNTRRVDHVEKAIKNNAI